MHPPERIENDVARGRLRSHWADAVVVLDHAALHEACRCAECQLKRHYGTPINMLATVCVTVVMPAGYGVQLVFSDEYARGIYPWAYLTELVATATTG